jgi:hypothetical protein
VAGKEERLLVLGTTRPLTRESEKDRLRRERAIENGESFSGVVVVSLVRCGEGKDKNEHECSFFGVVALAQWWWLRRGTTSETEHSCSFSVVVVL